MNIEQARRALKDGYERAGFDLVEVLEDGEIILRFPQPGAFDVSLRVTNQDAEEYAELLSIQGDFETGSRPTSFANTHYREVLLIPLNPNFPQDIVEDFKLRTDAQSETYVEIDKASPVFVNYFRFNHGYLNMCIDRIFGLPTAFRRASQKRAADVRHIFARPLTARVYNIEAGSIAEAVEKSDRLIESSLYTLAAEFDIALMVARDWPETRQDYLKPIQARKLSKRLTGLTIPPDNFRGDLVKLYQAGLATPIPSLKFLSFYNVLEFFFQSVDHAEVYSKLDTLLSSPTFKADQDHIARIVQTVEGHVSNAGMAALLENLIRQHISNDDLKDFLVSIDHAEESVRGLARRLTTLRDALVNAGGQHIPVDPDSAEIIRDVPLVRYLAEQVIAATGTQS